MAVIYLSHPRHGVKVATMELEAQADEASGWVRIDDPPSQEPSDEAPAPVNMMAPAADHGSMSDEAPRRRGRPRTVKDD